MNLTESAKSLVIAKATVYWWFHQGKILVPARKIGGLILIDTLEMKVTGQGVVYAKVSSFDQKSDLDR